MVKKVTMLSKPDNDLSGKESQAISVGNLPR